MLIISQLQIFVYTGMRKIKINTEAMLFISKYTLLIAYYGSQIDYIQLIPILYEDALILTPLSPPNQGGMAIAGG